MTSGEWRVASSKSNCSFATRHSPLVIRHYFRTMQRLKKTLGVRLFHQEAEPLRLRKGCNFHSAERVAFIYLDSDEEFFKSLKKYAKYLKENFNIKSVMMMGFVDQPDKKIPIWQQHKLESDFFSRSNLNWYLKPVSGVKNFIEDDFDILIDFSGGNTLPLNYVFKESKAKMKVGALGSRAARNCDFILNMGNQFGVDKYIVQLNAYLSNPKIK
jgi:hypothetical protein